MDQEIKLSIIICTFNRAVQLEQLLEDLVEQLVNFAEEDTEEVELILVDNNSTDNTKEIAYKYAESTILNLKYHEEDKQGLSNARNCGIKHAKGDLLAFLDDDVNLDDEWLEKAFELAKECKEREIGVYGGRVIPLWKERTPDWLEIDGRYAIDLDLFSAHNCGDASDFYPIQVEDRLTYSPSGTNVMLRREIFENCGDFRTDLGPNAAGGVGLHEDREFFDYLSALKIPMLYTPECTVFNPVEEKKMNKAFIRRWYMKSGMSTYWTVHTDRMKREVDPFYGIEKNWQFLLPSLSNKIKFGDVPVYLYVKFLATGFAWLLSFLSFNQAKIFHSELEISKTLGEIEAARMVKASFSSKKFSFRERIDAKLSQQIAAEALKQDGTAQKAMEV